MAGQSVTDRILSSLEDPAVGWAVSLEFERVCEQLLKDLESGKEIRPTLHNRAVFAALVSRGRLSEVDHVADQARAVVSHSGSIRRVSEALGWRQER